MKQLIKGIAERFNAKPLKTDWIQSAYEAGLVRLAESTADDAVTYFESFDSASVAEFLKSTPGLGKQQIGEFISKGPAHLFPFHASVLKEYVRTFTFEGKQECSLLLTFLFVFLVIIVPFFIRIQRRE